jgi:HTH-type transcriptional regulator/antitoxin HigA
MDIKPIRTEADYQAALREVESLMTAEFGTLEGARLDVLAQDLPEQPRTWHQIADH